MCGQNNQHFFLPFLVVIPTNLQPHYRDTSTAYRTRITDNDLVPKPKNLRQSLDICLYHGAMYDVTFCCYNVISKCGSLPEISSVLISRVRVFCDVKKRHESF